MATARDAQGNRYRYSYADQEWQPISDDFGVGATFREGVKNAATELFSGMQQIGLRAPGTMLSEQEFSEETSNIDNRVNNSRQALQMAGGDVYPIANFAGQALPYVVAGAASPTSLPGTMAFEAGLGAMTYGTPKERALNAGLSALGGGAGNLAGRGVANAFSGMSGRVQRSIAQAGEEARGGGGLARDLNDITEAPGGIGDEGNATVEGNRLRRAFERRVFPEETPNVDLNKMADDAGIKLNPGQRRGNKAQQAALEGYARNSGAQSVYDRMFTEPNTRQTTSNVREALGLDAGDGLTFREFQQADDAIMADFEGLKAVKGSYKILDDDVRTLRNMANTPQDANISRDLNRRFVDNMEKRLKGETPESELPFGDQIRMKPKDIIDTIRALNDGIGNAKASTEREALESMRLFWETRLENIVRASDDADMLKRWKSANEKYRVKKLLERPGAWKGDDINIGTLARGAAREFQNAMRRTDYLDGRGRPFEPATTRLLKNLQVVNAFPAVLGNSGTPTGQLMTGNMSEVASKLIQGRVGAEILYGEPFKAAPRGILEAARVVTGR